jgi:tetratricopeptide (TPR) repeat protein
MIEAGEFEAARMLFEAIEIDGPNSAHRERLLTDAEHALANGDFKRAYDSAMAAATGPSEERARAVLLAADALSTAGQKGTAVRTLEKMAKTLDASDAVLALAKAIDLGANEITDKEGVRFLLERFVDENPSREDVDQAIVQLLAITGDRTALAEYLVQARDHNPSPERFRHAAEIFLSVSQLDRAIHTLTLLYRRTDAIGDLFLLVDALRQAGQFEHLIELLEARRDEDPKIDEMLKQELSAYASVLKERIISEEGGLKAEQAPLELVPEESSRPSIGAEILEDEEDLEVKLSEAFEKLRLKE